MLWSLPSLWSTEVRWLLGASRLSAVVQTLEGAAALLEPHLHGTDSAVKTLLSSDNPITESVQGQQLYFIM